MRVDIVIILLAGWFLCRYISNCKRLYNKYKKLKIDKEHQYLISLIVLIIAFVIYLIYASQHPVSTGDKIGGAIVAVGIMIMWTIKEK